LSARLHFLDWTAYVLLRLVVISAILSAVQYFMKFWSQVDGSIKQRKRMRLLERIESEKKMQDVPTL
jgi:hypothetical protein